MKDLVAFLSLPSTSDNPSLAVDALVEFIQARRKQGQSFYEIMVVVIEVMQKVPPTLDPYFDLSRTICHIPPLADLSPTTKSPFITKSTPSALLSRIISTLSRCPQELSLETARESVLEWCLGMEGKIMDGKGAGVGFGGVGGGSGNVGGDGSGSGQGYEGRGGVGTIGMAGFDEIEVKFKEIVEALPNPDPHVLALLLSLRFSLSYLSLPSLIHQLSELSLPDSESVLRQWIKRRLPGEGRFTMCEKLNLVEREVGETRPALKAVIRLVRAKYLLPEEPVWKVPLPSQGKNRIIASLQAFVASGGMGTGGSTTSTIRESMSRSGPTSPIRQPTSPLGRVGVGARPPAYRSPSGNGPTSPERKMTSEQSLASYAIELLSEWLTKEKRDYMRAEKWTRSGRKVLSKDLNEVEEKLCWSSLGPRSKKGKEVAGSGDSGHNACLIPVFSSMRRIYNLDPRTGPTSSQAAAEYPNIDIPDEMEPYHPPTAQSVTSALYCNPRLTTEIAIARLLDLVDCEKDARIQSAVSTLTHSRRSSQGRWSHDGTTESEQEENEMREVAWGLIEKTKMGRVLDGIARRFPDGEYADAFKRVGEQTDCPPQLHRAPSYKSVASAFTAERTASYLRGTTSHRGSASISLSGSRVRQLPTFPSFAMSPVDNPQPNAMNRSWTTPPELPPEPEPASLFSLDVSPPRPFAHHARASSLPTTSLPDPLRLSGLPGLSIPSLSSLVSPANAGPDHLFGSPDRSEAVPSANAGGEIDLESFYAGYGDAIQPMTSDGIEHRGGLESPVGFTAATPAPAVVPFRQPPASPRRTSSQSRALSRSNDGFNGASLRVTSSRHVTINSTVLDRSRPVVMPRRADAPLHPQSTGYPHSPPTIQPGHSRQAPSLSPTSWRQEFMTNTMLKPAPRGGENEGVR